MGCDLTPIMRSENAKKQPSSWGQKYRGPAAKDLSPTIVSWFFSYFIGSITSRVREFERRQRVYGLVQYGIHRTGNYTSD